MVKKVGGITFVSVGRLQLSYCVKRKKNNNNDVTDFLIATGAVLAYFTTIHMMFSSL
jgi:hypothetical protein